MADSDTSGTPDHDVPTLDDVIDTGPGTVSDQGLPHDRTLKGGMPRERDEALEQLAEQDRVAAGVDAYDPEQVPSATE